MISLDNQYKPLKLLKKKRKDSFLNKNLMMPSESHSQSLRRIFEISEKENEKTLLRKNLKKKRKNEFELVPEFSPKLKDRFF